MTVGLFRAPLDLEPDQLETFAATLSAEEMARAGALQAPRARRRWIADHGWRRCLLAERLPNRAASQLTFTDSEHGKPRLTGAGPHFSASRSEDVAWYAVSDQAEVGVDVERVDLERPLERLAGRLLSRRERALYDAVPETARADALFACWTCKEAAVKALGSGLVFPLTALETWTGDGAPIRAQGLEIRGVTSDPGRAVAVAVRIEPRDNVTIEAPVDLSAR
ncbi:MAG TPA: 4'-phosphopantetheinyl transferase superfamily protein [Solirubrobacteraceae bacterium]